MEIKLSKRLGELTPYAFARIHEVVEQLKRQGVDVIDFGVGDPVEPTPKIIREALKKAVDEHAASGYPSYIGADKFRNAVVVWMKRRFGVDIDSEREVCASIGSKEAVFNFAEAFINPGDVVLAPNPGYPPFARGTRFAEGEVYYLNLLEKNNFLPDLESIPRTILGRAKILWINYPNNPTGAIAPRSFFEKVVEFGHKNKIIIASDEAYSENYYESPPPSMLEISKEGVVVFQSLSKRSCMTGYRVGWVAGDSKIVDGFKKLKTNIDSGTPTFIQDAAVVALSDEKHVEELRRLYKDKRDIMVEVFKSIGLPGCRCEATLHMWQKVPDGMKSESFAKKLLDPKIAVVTTPGSFISEDAKFGNPGEGYVRLSLVPSVDECKKAADRIRNSLTL